MTEEILQYLWYAQKFDPSDLALSEGQKLIIQSPGQWNHDAGPDFSNARLIIDDLAWAGAVEMHLKASEWYIHKHEQDPAYQQVILHVVWENDAPVFLNGKQIPTLILKGRVDVDVLNKSDRLLQNLSQIPCSEILPRIDSFYKSQMIEVALVERLQQKKMQLDNFLAITKGDWEEVTWILLCRAFGMGPNRDAFTALARNCPIKLLYKLRSDRLTVEALLFGQAGLLFKKCRDSYPNQLKDRWKFLQRKYELPRPVKPSIWKFLRLRPANFPTFRLAQLAAVIHKHDKLFEKLVQADTSEIHKVWDVEASGYWKTHFQFDQPIRKGYTRPGAGLKSVIFINAAAPVLFSYGWHTDNEELKNKAISLLMNLRAESNKVTRLMGSHGFINDNAADSQGLYYLYHQYCQQRHCLRCKIGQRAISI